MLKEDGGLRLTPSPLKSVPVTTFGSRLLGLMNKHVNLSKNIREEKAY